MKERRAGRFARWQALACGLAVALLPAGCTLARLKQDAADFYASTVLVGRIESPGGWRGPVVVSARTRGPGPGTVVHRTLLHEPGGYELIVPKGEYTVEAFGDTNGNGLQDPQEPAGRYTGSIPVLASGSGVIASLDFVLAGAGPAGGPPAAAGHSTQAGALADLDAPAFTAENGQRGYWAPMAFFREFGGNIYQLEPYDPARTPVLFVHGAVGSPQDWRAFFAQIDRTRYQPWFFYYPSGASVESMAYLLYWKLVNLQLRHRFERLHIVAHSMGGLVVRSFLLNHGEQFPQVRLFVSLSTPWAGETGAELGVKHSPAVVPSWVDMQPGGRFMQDLFARKLPPAVAHYLLFGHKGGYSLLRPTTDGTVTLASQLRSPAQAEARMVFGFDEDHDSILRAPQVLAQVQAILDSAGAPRGPGAGTGRVQPQFTPAGAAEGPRGLPLLVLDPVAPAAPGRGRVLMPLAPEDSGRALGPVPEGLYDASLVAAGYRSEPRRTRVQVQAGQVAGLSTRLVPQGTLAGYVGADRPEADTPAGSYRPPHPSVQIEAITLTGPGLQRRLQPRQAGADDVLDRYLAGEDGAYKAQFSFVNLPAGDYELAIEAAGYQPHRSRHTVLPGRPVPLAPIVLVPLR
ncbi:MAG: alpha/beta hydrolase [Burkholderiales bacterium]|nr:alpha/beta hydrolase [Burkholderiales bacterium]